MGVVVGLGTGNALRPIRNTAANLLSRPEIFELVTTYSIDKLRWCIRHRILILNDGRVAVSRTSRKATTRDFMTFEEQDFHAALLQRRQRALLHLATFNLARCAPDSSAQKRFTPDQSVMILTLVITFVLLMMFVSITLLTSALVVILSLLFFTMVLMRLSCLHALYKADK